MKKICSILLALALLLSLVTASVAEAANRNLLMSVEGVRDIPRIRELVTVGDALYLRANGTLYRLLPGEEEPQAFMDQLVESVSNYGDSPAEVADETEVSFLFVKDGCLYGFGDTTGAVTRLTDESGAPVREAVYTINLNELKMTDAGAGENTLFRAGAAYANDTLYVLYIDYSAAGNRSMLYSLGMSEGAEPVALESENLEYIAAYRDGKLLGATSSDYSGEEVVPGALVTYDPATGEQQKLCELEEYGLSALCWNEASDAVYFVIGSAVYTLAAPDAAPQLCAYLPEEIYDGSIACLSGGEVAVAGNSGVYLRTPSVGAADDVLVVSGEYGSQEHMAVVAEHPEIAITLSSDFMRTIEELSTAMVSGEGNIDVLNLSLANQPVEKLIEKGYALELEQFPEVMEIASRMDERFLAPLRKDGKLYALPTSLYASTASVNREQWTETLGLSESDLPTTWPELLDFIANYRYDYGEDHEELILCDSWNLKEDLMRAILESEIAYQWRENGGGELSFSTDRFVSLMKLLDEIDYSELSNSNILGEDATDSDFNEFYSKPMLFTLYSGYASNPGAMDSKSSVYPLVLALEDGAEPVIPAVLGVQLINPRTTRPELAATYMASFASHFDSVTTNVVLFPGNNEPVMNPNFEKDLEAERKYLEEREKALESADDEYKAGLREEVDNLREWLEEYKQTGGVRLSAEMIAAYREKFVPYLYPIGQTPVTSFGDDASSNVQNLIQQFSQGAIDAEAFVKELDGRVRLMMLENQ